MCERSDAVVPRPVSHLEAVPVDREDLRVQVVPHRRAQQVAAPSAEHRTWEGFVHEDGEAGDAVGCDEAWPDVEGERSRPPPTAATTRHPRHRRHRCRAQRHPRYTLFAGGRSPTALRIFKILRNLTIPGRRILNQHAGPRQAFEGEPQHRWRRARRLARASRRPAARSDRHKPVCLHLTRSPHSPHTAHQPSLSGCHRRAQGVVFRLAYSRVNDGARPEPRPRAGGEDKEGAVGEQGQPGRTLRNAAQGAGRQADAGETGKESH